jgi:pyruvate,water dikinase
MSTTLDFEPPNDGPWELDASHFDRPMPRYGVPEFRAGFEQGQARWLERVGMPMKGLVLDVVHGMPYGQAIPLMGRPADLAKPPPPAWMMKLVMWLHPAMRRRRANAERWLAAQGWREDLRRWDEQLKPELFARFAVLEAEPVEQLADEALIDHLARCGRALEDNLTAHFEMNALMLPVGAYLRRGVEWTGLTPVQLLDVIRPTGASSPLEEALGALACALEVVDDGPALLNGGRSPV